MVLVRTRWWWGTERQTQTKENKTKIHLTALKLQKCGWSHRYENSALKKLVFNMHGLCARHCCKGLHIYCLTWFSPISPAGIMTPFWTGIWSSRGFPPHLSSLTNKWQSKRLTFCALSMIPSSLATHWWTNVMLTQDSWNLSPGPKKEVDFSVASSQNWRWKSEGRVWCQALPGIVKSFCLLRLQFRIVIMPEIIQPLC